MSKAIEVGGIKFGDMILTVYDSLENPIFSLDEIHDVLGMDITEANGLRFEDLAQIEQDDYSSTYGLGYITERGLYNILAQGKTQRCRAWRRIIFDQLIEMRKNAGRNISEQFEEWNHALDTIYFDENTGIMMQSVTVERGDVIQVPYDN